ncbi:MAG TPA: hypothetical protein VLC09_21125 [Polyangiaceae bacterium]|nr:hypothetical protein [Polyangiaceae bacterium]
MRPGSTGLIVLVTAVAVTGCDIGAGLADLGDSLLGGEAGSYDAPGVLLAAGDFRDVLHFDNSSGRTTFRANTPHDDGDHTVLVSVDWGGVLSGRVSREDGVDVCDLGVLTYSLPWGERYPRLDDSSDHTNVWTFVDQDGDGYGTLGFVDRDCRVLHEPIEEFQWSSLRSLRGKNYGRTKSGEVFALDVYDRTVERVLEGIRELRVFDEHLHVWRDRSLVRLTDEGLFDEAVLGEGVTQLGDFTSDGLWFVGDTGLWVLEPGWEPRKLSDAGCYPIRDAGRYVFLDPCEERRVVLLVGTTRFEGPVVAGTPSDVTVGVVGTHTDDETQDVAPDFLIWLAVHPEGAEAGVDGGAERGVEAVHDLLYRIELTQDLRTWLFDRSSDLRSSEALLSIDQGIGQHFALREEYGLPFGAPLHDDVVELFWLLNGQRVVVGDYADGSATIWATYGLPEVESQPRELTSEAELLTKVLVSPGGTPFTFTTTREEFEEGSHSALVVADSEDGLRGVLLPLVFSRTESRVGASLASDVWAGTPRALFEERGLAYVRGAERTLEVQVHTSGLTVPIHSGVREYSELDKPATGLIFVVESGDERGIWFSKAR